VAPPFAAGSLAGSLTVSPFLRQAHTVTVLMVRSQARSRIPFLCQQLLGHPPQLRDLGRLDQDDVARGDLVAQQRDGGVGVRRQRRLLSP
jgi:hypothetical protein